MNNINNSSPKENMNTTLDPYIVKVQLHDGTVFFPAYVSWKDINFVQKITEAMELFSSRYRNKWVVEVVTDENIVNTQELTSWDTIKKEILINENDSKIDKVLKNLWNLWISPWLIDIEKEDLDFVKNEKLFRTYVELSNFTEEEKSKTIDAMEFAIEAHKGDTQKRKKDTEGLDTVPYSNHPVQVGVMALRDLKMSAEEVQAALLHDVIEDVDELERNGNVLKIRDMKSEFSEHTLEMVDDCSKNPNESRNEFMEKMKYLTWPSKVIKCLDRLHNMIRAFTINDADYIERYLAEIMEVYLPAFENMVELEPVRALFFDVLEELEKYLELLKSKKI